MELVGITIGILLWCGVIVAWLRVCRTRNLRRAVRLLGIVMLLLPTLSTATLARRMLIDKPLLTVAAEGDVLRLHTLLARGANVNVTSEGGTPLSQAIQNGHKEVVRVLLKNGADPNQRIGPDKQAPLALALKTDHPAIATLLKRAGGRE